MSLASNVVILDTGCCNLTSLKAAVERLGVDPIVSRDASVIRAAERLFLPGVGTAKAAMTMLKDRALVDLIIEAKQPVLGICLGMQLLGRTSEETGGVSMLGLIDQPVRQLKTGDLPLPHMGWNQINPTDDPLFKGIAPGQFTHSESSEYWICSLNGFANKSLLRNPDDTSEKNLSQFLEIEPSPKARS